MLYDTHNKWKKIVLLISFHSKHTVAWSNSDDVVLMWQLIIKSQDDQLDTIGSSVKVLKNMSHNISNELDEQSV